MTHDLNNSSASDPTPTPDPYIPTIAGGQGVTGGPRIILPDASLAPPPRESEEYKELEQITGKTYDPTDETTWVTNEEYEAHLASTGQIVFADNDPRTELFADDPEYQEAANSNLGRYRINEVTNGTGLAPLPWAIHPSNPKNIVPDLSPIFIENPPEEIPEKGTDEYKLLIKEIGGVIPEGFNYKSHIAATRQPKDYPDWLDPVVDIDDRWVDPTKLNTSKTFEKELEEYEFFRRSDGSIEIKTEEGFDEITGIPKLQFADKAVSAIAEIEATFDQVKAKDDVTGKMFRVYNAAFKRFPDSDGLEYWIEKNGSGENTERQVAESFLASNEFKKKYGEDVTNEQYVKTLYQNILDREPDLDGYNYWVGQLNNGIEDRSELLLGFAESSENQLLFSEVTGLYWLFNSQTTHK